MRYLFYELGIFGVYTHNTFANTRCGTGASLIELVSSVDVNST